MRCASAKGYNMILTCLFPLLPYPTAGNEIERKLLRFFEFTFLVFIKKPVSHL